MRINYKKYGFVRDNESDFSDDGAYFRCYKLGKIQITVCTDFGMYFISARASDELYKTKPLDYEVYSKLPGYKDLDLLNGVKAEEVTPEALQKVADASKEYEKAWLAA